MLIDELLLKEPFGFGEREKSDLFRAAMQESLSFHYEQCAPYRKFLDSQSFSPHAMNDVADIPPLSVSVFKDIELLSVPRDTIRAVVYSSATSSGKPSAIFLDERTIRLQQHALRAIMKDFIGAERMRFIVFDSENEARRGGTSTSSRSSAIRGFIPFANSMHFVLDDSLAFDISLFEKALAGAGPKEKICVLGFTWLLFKSQEDIRSDSSLIRNVQNALAPFRGVQRILHLGGWKKLAQRAVDKSAFNERVGTLLGTTPNRIIDIYGMVEQLGTIYPDCPYGYKHVPLFSDVIMRDMDTLKPLQEKQEGFIELLTPLPHSYPGIALISEDVGELAGIDNCPCGRKGKYFLFKRRLDTAPLKGCGDVLSPV